MNISGVIIKQAPKKEIQRSFSNESIQELLVKDVKNAPGIKNKLLYIIMAPGWSHTGEHKTARAVRGAFWETRIAL